LRAPGLDVAFLKFPEPRLIRLVRLVGFGLKSTHLDPVLAEHRDRLRHGADLVLSPGFGQADFEVAARQRPHARGEPKHRFHDPVLRDNDAADQQCHRRQQHGGVRDKIEKGLSRLCVRLVDSEIHRRRGDRSHRIEARRDDFLPFGQRYVSVAASRLRCDERAQALDECVGEESQRAAARLHLFTTVECGR
jgi:hypothetical protein